MSVRNWMDIGGRNPTEMESSEYPSKNVLVTSDMITDVTIPMAVRHHFRPCIDPKGDFDTQSAPICLPIRKASRPAQRFQDTDDRGEYRLFKLPPGTYYVAAVPRQTGNRPALPDNPVQVAPIRTYYLNVPDPASSSPVAVRGGEEISGVDIRLTTAVIGKISGQVVNTIPAEESVTRGGARGNRGGRGNNQAPAGVRRCRSRRTNQFPFECDRKSVPAIFCSETSGSVRRAQRWIVQQRSFEFRMWYPVSRSVRELAGHRGYGPQAAGQATSPMGFGRTTIEVAAEMWMESPLPCIGVTLKGGWSWTAFRQRAHNVALRFNRPTAPFEFRNMAGESIPNNRRRWIVHDSRCSRSALSSAGPGGRRRRKPRRKPRRTRANPDAADRRAENP